MIYCIIILVLKTILINTKLSTELITNGNAAIRGKKSDIINALQLDNNIKIPNKLNIVNGNKNNNIKECSNEILSENDTRIKEFNIDLNGNKIIFDKKGTYMY